MFGYVAEMISAAMCAFGRELSEPRIDPTGRLVAFVVKWNDRAAVVVVPIDGGPERIVTSEPAPPGGRPLGGGSFDWMPDGSAIVYAARDGNLWRQPIAGGPPISVTVLPDGQAAQAPAVSFDGHHVCFVVEFDDRDTIVVAPTMGPGPPVTVTAADFCFDPVWFDDGRVAWHEWDGDVMPWDRSRIVSCLLDGSDRHSHAADPDVGVQQPRSNARRLGWLSDSTGYLNVTVDGRTVVAEPYEHGGPAWGRGQRSWAWSPDGSRIAFNRNEDGFGRLCIADVATGHVTEVAKAVHGGLSWVGTTIAAVRTGARTPTQIVAYDVSGPSPLRRVLAIGPVAFDENDLVEPTVVDYPANDATMLHGRFYEAGGDGPARVICWLHGGPTDQWPVTFNVRIAYWVARGWSIFVPDHRGSTGYGRGYQRALDGRWGDVDVSDTVSALQWLASSGKCRAEHIVVMGGSASGLTLLAVVAHHHGLCAAAVALYPVTDLEALHATTHRFEAQYTPILAGPVSRWADASPVSVAERIDVPVLLLHGDSDEVVLVPQTEEFARRMTAAGNPPTMHIYAGEGHGWRRAETTLDEYQRIGTFVDAVVAPPT